MIRSLVYSLTFHTVMIILTVLSLPFMLREPIDLPTIVSVELIQISDKTNIPYAPKARKIIEETNLKFIEENLSSDEIDLPLILNFIPNIRALMNSVVTDDLDAAISRKKMEKKDLFADEVRLVKTDITAAFKSEENPFFNDIYQRAKKLALKKLSEENKLVAEE